MKCGNGMTFQEFQLFGEGTSAYITTVSHDEAQKSFPDIIDNMPNQAEYFLLHAPDGSPLFLADTRQAVIGHAMGDDRGLVSVH